MTATPSDKLKLFRIRRTPKGGRKAAAPGPDVEEKILDAAEFVFGHFGYRGATTALIAKKASIAKPHIYYYFEDKEDLYRAVLERAMNMWARHMDNLDTTSDIKTILMRYIHKKLDFSRDHPHLSRTMQTKSSAAHNSSAASSRRSQLHCCSTRSRRWSNGRRAGPFARSARWISSSASGQ